MEMFAVWFYDDDRRLLCRTVDADEAESACAAMANGAQYIVEVIPADNIFIPPPPGAAFSSAD